MFEPRRRRNDEKNGRNVRRSIPAFLEPLEERRLLSTFIVKNTGDLGSGSLRAAILAADADNSPGTDNIVFAIPASTAPELNVPVAGFNTSTQDWTITPGSPLPAITRPVSIDGYTQAHAGAAVPFLYPDSISSTVQTLSILGSPTGGTFTLTTAAPLPVGTTAPIPYTADAGTVQNALATVIGAGNVVVTGGPLPNSSLTITFQGIYASTDIPDLTSTDSLTGGTSPTVAVATSTIGGVAGTPTYINSAPNSVAAIDGNNAQVRVIIDGSGLTIGPTDIGFVIDASNSILRGLAIEGFNVGVSVPNTTNVGDLIQGNFIGDYITYPVDPDTGVALPSPDSVVLTPGANTLQAVLLGSANATVGGTDPQDSNVIAGNGEQGIELLPGASGNQVLDNQIGVVGPIEGYYFQDANGAEGVLIQSLVTPGDEASFVYTSSNIIGGAASGAGNIISANDSHGVHIEGVGATRNLVEANFIGAAPGGGYIFGSGDPGNNGDGVWIDDAPDNQVGGATSSDGNVIASNAANGVHITGAGATGNTVLNNIIGLTSGGATVLGNRQAGVSDTAPGTVIGPGNVISANLIGVLISGATATDVTVTGNLIGTDATGEADLGNAQAGVDIESATGAIVKGNGQGSQVISGNQVGVLINGVASTQNLVVGNYIGIDEAGTADRGNSEQGVLIEGAPGNTVGGTTAAARNVISANLYGIELDGSAAQGNILEGNYIGTDATGTLPLGNETQGVIFSNAASNNTVGGTATGQGNTIAFNATYGVYVGSGAGNSILSNSIFSNGQQGIVLNTTYNANNLISAPNLVTAIPSSIAQTTSVQGTFSSLPFATVLIQFFSNLSADPAGNYEGQTYLGSTTVTTGSNGSATFSATVPTVVASSSFITATATSLSTIVPGLTAGDSSAFSGAILSKAVSVQFTTGSYAVTVSSSAGIATINVSRTGNMNATVSVNYATSNGTAIAGENYSPASGTLTFVPQQTTSSFSVTILPNTSQASGSKTVNLTLSQRMGGAALGSISTAILTINLTPGPAPGPDDGIYPRITSEHLIVTGSSITAVTLAFSKAMNLSRAQDVGNYGFYVFSEGYRYTAGTTYTALSSAVYNSASDTVTLYPASPLPLNKFFEITVDGQASPLLHNGLIDLADNQLVGSSGAPGTPLVMNFAAGTKLSYVDSGKNAVSLKLTKGGVMEMFISPLGVVEQLQLVSTVPAKSTLNGSVRRGHGGTGRAVLPPIGNSAGTRIRLKSPPFYFRGSPTIDAETLARPAVDARPNARTALRLSRRGGHA